MIPKQIHFPKVIGFLLLFLNTHSLYSQKISVPKTLEVAGIKLRISEQARRLIERKIISILKQKKNFEQNLYRAYLYLPIIEEILVKEKLPKDYKYLALQISDLDPKKHNKLHEELGFWQIAQEDMEKMKLLQNENFDERMSIIKSTKAMAKRLYRSNQFHFRNWVINILSLQMGEENAKKYIKKSLHRSDYLKAQVMSITQNNHDFILTFLAIKVLYDDKIKPNQHFFNTTLVKEMKLKKLAKQYKISLSELLKYNPHIKNMKFKITNGQDFYTIIPQFDSTKLHHDIKAILEKIDYPENEVVFLPEPKSADTKIETPVISNKIEREHIEVEEISREVKTTEEFHIVRNGENLYDIARKYKIRIKKLRHYNHINRKINRLYIGQKIYLIPPRKAIHTDSSNLHQFRFTHHIVSENQTLYQIAKMYNVRTQDIKKWNSLDSENLEKNQELLIKRRNLPRRLQSSGVTYHQSFSHKMQITYHKKNLLKTVKKKH